jgi:hypothetical protein
MSSTAGHGDRVIQLGTENDTHHGWRDGPRFFAGSLENDRFK